MRAQDKQAEKSRLKQAAHDGVPWKKWGPYLSERQWGGVRENVDRNIEAWDDALCKGRHIRQQWTSTQAGHAEPTKAT